MPHLVSHPMSSGGSSSSAPANGVVKSNINNNSHSHSPPHSSMDGSDSSPLLSLALTATEGPKAANFASGPVSEESARMNHGQLPPHAVGVEKAPESAMTTCVDGKTKEVALVSGAGVTDSNADGGPTSTLITPVAPKRSRDDMMASANPASANSTAKTPKKEEESAAMNPSSDSTLSQHMNAPAETYPGGSGAGAEQFDPSAPFVPQGPFDPRIVSPYHQYHMTGPGGWNETMGPAPQTPYSPYWPPHYNPYMKGYNGQFSPPHPGMPYSQYPMMSGQPHHPPFQSPQVDQEKKLTETSSSPQEKVELKDDEVKKNIFGKMEESVEVKKAGDTEPPTAGNDTVRGNVPTIKTSIHDDEKTTSPTTGGHKRPSPTHSDATKTDPQAIDEAELTQAKKLKSEEKQPGMNDHLPSMEKSDLPPQASDNPYMHPPSGYHPYPPYYPSMGRGYGGYHPPYGYFNHYQDPNSMAHEYPQMQPPPLWYPPHGAGYPGPSAKGQDWQGGQMYPPGMYPYGPMMDTYGPPDGEGKDYRQSVAENGEHKQGGHKNELATAMQKSTPEVDSVHRCKQLVPVPSNKMWTDEDALKDVTIPEFQQLVNFPTYLQKNRSPLLSHGQNGMRRCVMCGLERPFTVNASSGGGGVSPSQRGMLRKGLAPDTSNSKNDVDYTMQIIPRQNKGLCTACDVAVWEVIDSKIEIKWCKGCKNFKPWQAFGEKGMATKCVKCRERQREKYALKKEQMKKDVGDSSQKENEENQKKKPSGTLSRGRAKKHESYGSSSPPGVSSNGLSCLIAATDQVNSNTEQV